MKLITDFLKIRVKSSEKFIKQEKEIFKKARPSQKEFVPKKIVECYTCRFIYNSTNKKERMLHKAVHYEYLQK